MQVALIITVMLLVMITSYQSAQLKDLEEKTLEAFKIVCKKLKAEKDEALEISAIVYWKIRQNSWK